ncbi:MAG: hypothetical protein HYR71_09175 [Chloroflexi bacterium]|nr:hypothetical protein [Chloroflexota bacterium]
MRVDLHGIVVDCDAPDAELRARWDASFASCPRAEQSAAAITFRLRLAPSLPPAPDTPPIFSQGDLLSVHQPAQGAPERLTVIHFPRFGQLRIRLAEQVVEGVLIPAALDTYGVFEDVVAMGLSALLRRHGLFLIHAFAAAIDGRALLLVGDIGSGKTTTGISLLRAGWQLLSNDSPLLTARSATVWVLSYPGLLSADQDTLRRFPELQPLAAQPTVAPTGRVKITFAAESIYPGVWLAEAPARAIVFPRVAHRATHQVTRLSEPDALRRLLPNAIDRWDTAMIPEHLQLLKTLAATAPAYQVELGEHTESLPALMNELLGG